MIQTHQQHAHHTTQQNTGLMVIHQPHHVQITLDGSMKI